MEILKELYRKWAGEEATAVEPLPESGSNRTYYRLSSSHSHAVGVIGSSVDENSSFIYLSQDFKAKGLPVPEVFGVSSDGSRYLQEDLGSLSLFDAVHAGREKGGDYSVEEISLLRKTISCLPDFQFRGGEKLDWEKCYPLPAMGRASVQFDLNYFKYDFLKFMPVDFHEFKLEVDMHAFADDLLSDVHETFLYRDFQARNVMLVGSEPRFIDFQGGRRGPIYYDVASFLWQASARYPDSLKMELIDVYLESLSKYIEIDRERFMSKLRLFVLFRLLQVLGAYGYRGLFERKRHFISSLAPALRSLRKFLDENSFSDYPYLVEVLRKVLELKTVRLADGTIVNLSIPDAKPADDAQKSKSEYDNQGELKVTIFSFSYKLGLPQDASGNGGGYVFDCRGTHNPGRYEEFKTLTGLDEPVVDFLEKDGEITEFLKPVFALADHHVERYMERGFTSLMFCFGCTGGRHRSVYSAQRLAEHLSSRYGVEIELIHRERGIHTRIPKKRR